MGTFAKHRIEQAKEQLRAKLTFEYIVSLPKYKHFTRDQYEALLDQIDTLCLSMLNTYCRINKIEP